jgi:hypothetical protein
MKYILILCIFLYGKVIFAQSILYNSTDATSGTKKDEIFDVHPENFTNKLVIIKKNHTKEKFDYEKSNIWGYENNDHQIFRLYNGLFYLVKNIDGPIFIYFTQSDKYPRSEKDYFFSFTLDSTLIPFSKNSIIKVFNADTCFIRKINLIKPRRNIYKMGETEIGNPEIINTLYKECHP